MKIRIYILILFFLFFIQNINSQKVGLVLSGGGSKGVAHIGVIKALEENNIPIDYITGTSMGAIIGGLYTAGYSPEEMRNIFLSEEFPNWITGKIDTKYNYYFKKESPNASWIDIRFDYKSTLKPQLPTNIISPHQMDFAFLEIFSAANAAAANNFDSLMIPFRCVAADIYRTKPITLGKGDLGKAIRASMTFPFYFKPVKIDSTLMFDGGMYNNFPADVMYEEFFPDIIIGSKVAMNFEKPDEDDIVSQLQNMLMEKTDYSTICGNGVLISPNIKRVNLVDFSNTSEFIDSGYTETIRNIDKIKFFVKDSISVNEINLKRNKFKEKKQSLIVDTIIINGLNENQKYYINKSLLKKNKDFTLQDIKIEYFKILADNKINSIEPTLTFNSQKNKFDLNLNIKKDKNFVAEFGGNISSSPINEAFIQLQYKTLSKYASSFFVNTYIGKFYSSALAKVRFDFPNHTPLYIESSFVIHQWDYFKTKTYFFEDKTPSYLIQNEKYVDLSLGLPSANRAKHVFRFVNCISNNEYYQNNTFGRNDTSDQTNFNYQVFCYLYEFNTLNKKQYANQGSFFKLNLRYLFGNEEYFPGSTFLNRKSTFAKHNWIEAKITFEKYFNKIKSNTFGISAETNFSNQSFFDNYTSSILNTAFFSPVPETKTLFLPKLRANIYGAIGLKDIVSIMKNLDFRLECYIFQPYREIFQNNNLKAVYGEKFKNQYFIGSTGLVLHSPIGPISLFLNYYQNSDQPFSLIFNFGYIIFNQKARN